MPRVRAYRRMDGTLVRAHSRAGSVSLKKAKFRIHNAYGSGTLNAALQDWSRNLTYLDNAGNMRWKRSKRVHPSSKFAKNTYGFKKPPYEGALRFHRRAARLRARGR